MADPANVLAYLHRRYPLPARLSGVRLRRMAYLLADWKSAMERGRQMTGLSWIFSDRGPDCPEAGTFVQAEFSAPARGLLARYPSLTIEDRRLLRFVARSVRDKGCPRRAAARIGSLTCSWSTRRTTVVWSPVTR